MRKRGINILWGLGNGNLENPNVLASMNPTLFINENNKGTTSWDVTAWMDTAAKVNDLKFVVRNNDPAGKKTFIDHIYAEITYI